LLSQIPPEQEIGSVTADGAYDTRNCHDVIADRGAHAIIPPRKNAKPWKPTTAGALAIVLEPCMDGPLARALFGSGISVGRGHVYGVSSAA